MKMTEAQLIVFESALEARGYKKYIPNDLNGYDVSRISHNEDFHWYKTILKEREEDEDGEMCTKFGVIVYIAFWDSHKYVDKDNIFPRYSADMTATLLDEDYYSHFNFPFFQDHCNSIFTNYIIEGEKTPYLESRLVSAEEINHLIDTIEELGFQSGYFYKTKCLDLLYKNLRNG